jgi:hypothetical protein
MSLMHGARHAQVGHIRQSQSHIYISLRSHIIKSKLLVSILYATTTSWIEYQANRLKSYL